MRSADGLLAGALVLLLGCSSGAGGTEDIAVDLVVVPDAPGDQAAVVPDLAVPELAVADVARIDLFDSGEPVLDAVTDADDLVDATAVDLAMEDLAAVDVGAVDLFEAVEGEDSFWPDLDFPDMPDGTQGVMGMISGSCGELADLLESEESTFLTNSYFSADPDEFYPQLLMAGAKKRFDEPNAGGSSKCSEVMSLQLLHDCEGALLYKTETEVDYVSEGKMTDYVVTIGEDKVGVSVTRAYKGPNIDVYTAEDALTLLEKKLQGINESSANVHPDDAWVKQVLHVWTLHEEWVEILEVAYAQVAPEVRSNSVVLVTVENNSSYIVMDSCDE